MKPLFIVLLVIAGFYAVVWLASIAYIIRDVGWAKYRELPFVFGVAFAPAIVIMLALHQSMEAELQKMEEQ